MKWQTLATKKGAVCSVLEGGSGAPVVTAGLGRLGRSARGDVRIRVFVAQLFLALMVREET